MEMQPRAFSTIIVVVLLYIFSSKLWEYRIINLSCFRCTHEKVFLLTAYRCVMQKSRVVCISSGWVVGMHGKMCTGNIRHAWLLILRCYVTLKTIAFVHELQLYFFYFILYAFVAWVLVGNRNVLGISMNDSVWEFVLETKCQNALENIYKD